MAGTLLSDTPPNVERELFVAAFEKVAAEAVADSVLPPLADVPACPTTIEGRVNTSISCEATDKPAGTDRIVLQHLYEISEIDERAGNYERADQWRALAREIRQSNGATVTSASANQAAAAEPTLNSP